MLTGGTMGRVCLIRIECGAIGEVDHKPVQEAALHALKLKTRAGHERDDPRQDVAQSAEARERVVDLALSGVLASSQQDDVTDHRFTPALPRDDSTDRQRVVKRHVMFVRRTTDWRNKNPSNRPSWIEYPVTRTRGRARNKKARALESAAGQV